MKRCVQDLAEKLSAEALPEKGNPKCFCGGKRREVSEVKGTGKEEVGQGR